MDGATSLVHATCVAVDGSAALITGPSGSGKSDLALRCIGLQHNLRQGGQQFVLVADDQVVLKRRQDDVFVQAPPALSGRLEIRGVGIMKLPAVPEARLALIVELVDASRIDRLPDREFKLRLLDLDFPALRLAPFEASAPLKVFLALTIGLGG